MVVGATLFSLSHQRPLETRRLRQIPIQNPLGHLSSGRYRQNVVNLKPRVELVRADGTRQPQ